MGEIGTSYAAGYLLDQLLRTASRTELGPTLRPGLRTKELIDIPGFVDDDHELSESSRWFRQFDGQTPGGPPLIASRQWRALSAKEAMAARRQAEPQGAARQWVPLFVDENGRFICWPGSDSARLRYLHGEKGRLPPLDVLLLEALKALGWREPDEGSVPEAPLGVLLEELDVLLATTAQEDDGRLGLRPGASKRALSTFANALGLQNLPDDLALWFSWHDGEEIDEDDVNTRIHPDYLARVLSIREVQKTRSLLMEGDDDAWDEAWLPIMTSRSNEHWGYVLSGESAGSIVFQGSDDDEDEIGASVRWPSLASFVWECVLLHRRSLEHPELQVPASHHISVDQRRVLALGGILSLINNERHDLLGGERPGVGAVVAHSGMAYWWGLFEGEDVCEKAESLIAPHERRFGGGAKGEVGDDVAFDLGRVHYIVGNAYLASLIEADRAWGYCVRAARVAQRAYPSWQAFGTAYASFRMADAEEDGDIEEDDPSSDDEIRQRKLYRLSKGDGARAVARLLAPDGAWRDLPWSEPIADCPPPILTPPTPTPVASSAELVAAIIAANQGDCIALAPGTYRHKLVLTDKCLSFVALDEGVVWEATGSESCIMERLGIFATFIGITFKAQGALHDAPGTCARVDDGFLVFRRCHFEAAHFGVVVADDAAALLEDCVFDCGESGVVAEEDAHLIMRRCHIRNADVCGISVDKAKVSLRGCRIDDSGGHALYCEGGSTSVDDLIVNRSQYSAIALSENASLTIQSAQIADAGESGISLTSGASLELSRSEILRVGKSGVCAKDASMVTLTHCRVADCKENAILFEHCARTFARDCAFDDTGLTVVAVVGKEGSRLALNRCEIGASRELDALFASNASVEIHDTVFAKSPRIVVSLEGARASLVRCKLGGAVGTGVVASEGSQVLLADSTVREAENGIWAESGSRVWLRRSVIGACKVGVIALSGAEIAALDCRVEDIETRAFAVRDKSTCLLCRSGIARTGAPAVDLYDASGWLLDLTFDDTKFAACIDGSTVEGRRLKVGTTTFSGFEVEGASHLRLVDSHVAAPGEAAIFAHDGGRAEVVGGKLSALHDVCCELTKGAHVTLRGTELCPGPKGAFAVDQESHLVETDRTETQTLGWKPKHGAHAWSASHGLPTRGAGGDAGWAIRLATLVDLLSPALRERVFLRVVGERLFAASEHGDSLDELQALVARLLSDEPFAAQIDRACRIVSASGPLVERIPFGALLRALAFASGGMLTAETGTFVLHGWRVASADGGFSVTLARYEDIDEASKHLAATEEALMERLGAPFEEGEWRYAGALIRLRLNAERNELVANVAP